MHVHTLSCRTPAHENPGEFSRSFRHHIHTGQIHHQQIHNAVFQLFFHCCNDENISQTAPCHRPRSAWQRNLPLFSTACVPDLFHNLIRDRWKLAQKCFFPLFSHSIHQSARLSNATDSFLSCLLCSGAVLSALPIRSISIRK